MNYSIALLCMGVVGAVFVLLPVRELKNTYFVFGTVALCALVVAYSLQGAVPLINYFNRFDTSEFSFYFKILIKVLGITALCNVTSDFVSDLVMPALSGKIEFAGKIAVMLTTLPLFEILIGEVEKLI